MTLLRASKNMLFQLIVICGFATCPSASPASPLSELEQALGDFNRKPNQKDPRHPSCPPTFRGWTSHHWNTHQSMQAKKSHQSVQETQCVVSLILAKGKTWAVSGIGRCNQSFASLHLHATALIYTAGTRHPRRIPETASKLRPC